jgi:hypothetical protein
MCVDAYSYFLLSQQNSAPTSNSACKQRGERKDKKGDNNTQAIHTQNTTATSPWSAEERFV